MNVELNTQVAVIGGGVGGFTAALAALRRGCHVIITEEYDRLGGQLTSQAVPPDEHPWIEHFGLTHSYRTYRRAVRNIYRNYYPLKYSLHGNPVLNPGNGFVSHLCHEPLVSRAVLKSFLLPFEINNHLKVLLRHVPIAADVEHDQVKAVTLVNEEGDLVTITASVFIDATELGDLLPLCNCEHVIGAEGQAETGEPHASRYPNPRDQQSHSWCFAIDYQPGVDNTIEKPATYDFWRSFVPNMTPSWGGPLLSWQATHPITLEPVVRSFNPQHPRPERGPMDLWTFRRIIDKSSFGVNLYPSDIVLVNWPQIDYVLGPLVGVKPDEKAKNLEGARQLSLSMMYWMQTEAPREDGGTGWPGLRLLPSVTETDDGLAAAPYIRESRRIKGRFTVLEQHLSPACQPKGAVTGEKYFDSVGVGAYRIDLHPSTAGRNYIDVSALPFYIPLGALIPQRLTNLIAGGKDISVTHITNGCYRLHPVEWNVGEVAGHLAALYVNEKTQFDMLYRHPEKLADFQRLLESEGIPTSWDPDSPALKGKPDSQEPAPPLGPL